MPESTQGNVSANNLTKREHIAALALQGLLANPDSTGYSVESTISSAVNFADALIKALNN